MDKKISYEEALRKIEEIVVEMESGSMPLEKTIEKYKEAIGLVDLCQKQLDDYEKMIKKISKKDGDLIIEDFDDEI